MENYFNELSQINVNDKTEKKKSGRTELTYLSWSFAWGEIKKRYPEATYKVKKFGEDNRPYLHDKELGYLVMTEVTVNEVTHEMWLPVMDGANKAMKSEPYSYETKYNGTKNVEQASMFDINKTIMRCLVKNIGMHGLGLYIYAGEDLPSEEDGNTKVDETKVYQQMVTDKFNELVTKFGTNTEVYKRIGKTKTDFLKDYKENPQMLLELLNGF